MDPPYNSNASEIMYKNNYKNSSWLSLMKSRLELGKQFLNDDGIQCTTIDDVEQSKLNILLEENTREIINELKVVRQDNGLYYVYRRRRPNEGVQPLTTWDDSIYSATEHGTDLLKRMGILILTYHH